MAHIRRTIGDPEGITRREATAGALTIIGSVIAASAVGGIFIGTYQKVKDYIGKRISVLYANDEARTWRMSHENPEIIALYESYLSPGEVTPSMTELSHRLCHTVFGDDVKGHVAKLRSIPVSQAEQETIEQMARTKA